MSITKRSLSTQILTMYPALQDPTDKQDPNPYIGKLPLKRLFESTFTVRTVLRGTQTLP